jgi:DNA-binding GntR family transcriptional regulator
MESSSELLRRRPRSLALELVEALGDRIREGRLAAGHKLPTEAEFMAEFGVSRTVVREAISKLQAAGLTSFELYQSPVLNLISGRSVSGLMSLILDSTSISANL